MKTIEFSERNRSGNLLHVETPLGVVNIRIGLSDALGRRVNAIECLPNRYAGEPEVGLDGYSNTRMIEDYKPHPTPAARKLAARLCGFMQGDLFALADERDVREGVVMTFEDADSGERFAVTVSETTELVYSVTDVTA